MEQHILLESYLRDESYYRLIVREEPTGWWKIVEQEYTEPLGYGDHRVLGRMPAEDGGPES